MRVLICKFALPFINEGSHLNISGLPFIYEGPIYIWRLPFIYEGSHLYMTVSIYIWGSPFTYEGRHLHMRGPIFIWGFPFMYEGSHWVPIYKVGAGKAWVDHVILHVCNHAVDREMAMNVQAISTALAGALWGALLPLLQQSSTAMATAQSSQAPSGSSVDFAVAVAVEDCWSSSDRALAKVAEIACTTCTHGTIAQLHTWSITWSTQALPARLLCKWRLLIYKWGPSYINGSPHI